MRIIHKYILLSLPVFLLFGCARSADFGKLVRSKEANNSFASATVLPDHTYYYTGPEAKPTAIMALHNSFTLANKKNFWIKVDATEEQLQMWNRIISNDTRIRFPYYGSRIITPDGRQAGIWYSKYDHTVIKTPEPQSIIVYTPDIEPKNRFRADQPSERVR